MNEDGRGWILLPPALDPVSPLPSDQVINSSSRSSVVLSNPQRVQSFLLSLSARKLHLDVSFVQEQSEVKSDVFSVAAVEYGWQIDRCGCCVLGSSVILGLVLKTVRARVLHRRVNTDLP